MDLIQDCLIQWAVYWPPTGLDDFNRQGYGPPVKVACRWDEGNEVVTDRNGQPFNSTAQVMLDRDVKLLGRLYLAGAMDAPGTADRLAAGMAATDPDSLGGEAKEISRFDKVPDIDGEDFVRTAYL